MAEEVFGREDLVLHGPGDTAVIHQWVAAELAPSALSKRHEAVAARPDERVGCDPVDPLVFQWRVANADDVPRWVQGHEFEEEWKALYGRN